MIVLWVTEAVPLWLTALLVPIVIVTSGMGTAKAALAPFFHPIIALFFGGFMIAEAMHRVGLDHRIATWIVARAGRSPATLFAAMLGVSAFLSMWMSNTAATAVLVPIAIAVTAPLHHLGYRKAMVLGIAYAATIGGVGSLIGTPANPLAAEFLDTFVGRTITFVDWFAFGLPLVVLFLPVMGVYLWRRSKVSVPREAFDGGARSGAPGVRRRGRRDQGPEDRPGGLPGHDGALALPDVARPPPRDRRPDQRVRPRAARDGQDRRPRAHLLGGACSRSAAD